MKQDLSMYGRLVKHASNMMSRHIDSFAAGYGLTGVQLSIIDFWVNIRNRFVCNVTLKMNLPFGDQCHHPVTTDGEKGLVVRSIAKSDARQNKFN